MSSLYDYDYLYGLNPPVYIDTEGARVVQSRFTEKGIFTSKHQACLPRQGDSHSDTGEAFYLVSSWPISLAHVTQAGRPRTP